MDGGLSDAAMEASVDAEPPPDADPYAAFVEEFSSADNVDGEMSTAWVNVGMGVAEGSYRLLSAGTGDEAFPSELMLAAGRHSYSFAVIREEITIPGDAVLEIRDDFSLEETGALVVEGDLDIGVGGYFDLRGRIEVTGDLRIHLSGTSAFTISSSGRLVVNPSASGDGGDIELYTRGAMTIQGSVSAGDAMTFPGRGGSITVRAYRDVNLRGADGGFRVGAGPGGDGDLGIYTEGAIQVLDAPTAFEMAPTAEAMSVPELSLHAGEGVELSASMIWGTSPFDFDLQARGTVTMVSLTYTGGSGAGTGSLSIHGGNVTVSGSSTITAPTSNSMAGGAIDILSAGTITVGGSSLLLAGEGRCASGGSVTLTAMESISINGSPTLRGGNSEVSPGCMLGSGGSVRVSSAASVTVSGMMSERFVVGMGMPPGEVAVESSAAVALPELDPRLERTTSLYSVPIGLLVPRVRLVTVEPVWIAPEGTSAELLLSPDGTDDAYQRADELLMMELRNGFRYRVNFVSRFFESHQLDRFRLEFEAP